MTRITCEHCKQNADRTIEMGGIRICFECLETMHGHMRANIPSPVINEHARSLQEDAHKGLGKMVRILENVVCAFEDEHVMLHVRYNKWNSDKPYQVVISGCDDSSYFKEFEEEDAAIRCWECMTSLDRPLDVGLLLIPGFGWEFGN